MPLTLRPATRDASHDARIEIIPLIDIMFFLLASFMLVSLSLVNLNSVPVNLPTAVTATPDTQRDFVSLAINQTGLVQLDRQPVGPHELVTALVAARQARPAVRVFISADRDARHGDVIRVLDLVRTAGIETVAFETRLAPPS